MHKGATLSSGSTISVDWQVKYTRLAMMLSQLNTFIQYMPEYKTTLCSNSCGVSLQERAYYEKQKTKKKHVLFTEKQLLIIVAFSTFLTNISSENDGYE